jgi:hypothetical protein
MKNYIEPKKNIHVYTGSHGAGKTSQFYKDFTWEYYGENGSLPCFINETQRSIKDFCGLEHSNQDFNLQINKNILFLIYSDIIKNEDVVMDRSFFDVLIYNYYFDNSYRYECDEEFKKTLIWFIKSATFNICEPQEKFFDNEVERMDYKSALEIHKLFLDIDNVLSKILGFNIKLKKEYYKL